MTTKRFFLITLVSCTTMSPLFASDNTRTLTAPTSPSNFVSSSSREVVLYKNPFGSSSALSSPNKESSWKIVRLGNWGRNAVSSWWNGNNNQSSTVQPRPPVHSNPQGISQVTMPQAIVAASTGAVNATANIASATGDVTQAIGDLTNALPGIQNVSANVATTSGNAIIVSNNVNQSIAEINSPHFNQRVITPAKQTAQHIENATQNLNSMTKAIVRPSNGFALAGLIATLSGFGLIRKGADKAYYSNKAKDPLVRERNRQDGKHLMKIGAVMTTSGVSTMALAAYFRKPSVPFAHQ